MSSWSGVEPDSKLGTSLRKGQRRALYLFVCVAPLFLVLFVGGAVSTIRDMNGSLTAYFEEGTKAGPAWMWLLAFALGSITMVSVGVWAVFVLVKDSLHRRST
ncbi:hypothetical protein [Pengzhenrongella phosphoraccumulans]|jgi:predicted metal-binding membrane protein|uniref:hypothetical protein n=1 Tax=Pengzhenrongella phosphoraccumulans TaxID=3114394 RepID=UPI00388FA7EE